MLVAVLAAGCGHKKDEASCGAVATRLFTLAHDDLGSATVDPAIRRAVADQLPAMRDSLTQICTDGKWSTQVRNCMVSAGDHLALQACQQHLTDEQRRALDRATVGETTSH
ncbi:MAG TPA: hypothetical protein VFV99_04205 [Kofleriaceae bacterium]|nr:hypothetical protein [Kofleriaceae bacterium]